MILPVLLSSFMLVCCVSLSFKKSPLGLSITVLGVAISLTFLSCLVLSPWYSYIGFLIYVGAILMMFAYISVLTPESPRSSLSFPSGLVVLFLSLCWVLFDVYSSSVKQNYLAESYKGEDFLSSPEIYLILPLGGVLYLAMLGATKICRVGGGPLRLLSK